MTDKIEELERRIENLHLVLHLNNKAITAIKEILDNHSNAIQVKDAQVDSITRAMEGLVDKLVSENIFTDKPKKPESKIECDVEGCTNEAFMMKSNGHFCDRHC